MNKTNSKDQADEIIVSLLKTDDFNNCMSKINPSLKEDLRSELILILLEKPPEEIIRIHEKKELTFYTVRILLRLAFSVTSPMHKKYRSHNEFTDIGTLDDNSIIQRKQTEERALDEIEKLEWYESEMMKLYVECGNYRGMEKRTRIPYSSCFCTVKNAIKKIQEVI